MATIERFITRVTVEGADKLDRLGSTADQVNAKMNGLISTLAGLSFGALIKGALDSADRMADLSDATGITVASIKAFGQAMNDAGGNSKNAEKAIMALYSAIESAADGSEKTQSAFQRVGVSLNDLRNLSETDILNKTIKGLSEMSAGSERSAVATALLGRSFRGIDTAKFLEALDAGKYQDAEKAILAAADANQKMEQAMGNLQLGALKAIQPIIEMFGETELSIAAAEKMVKAVGIAMGVVFGVQAVAGIAGMITAVLNLNKALLTTAAVSNLIGKTPLGVLVKLGAATAAGAGIAVALDELISKNDQVEASATAAAKAQSSVTAGQVQATTPNAGPAGRIVKLSPQAEAAQKAAQESEKRIRASQAEYERILAQDTANELVNIRANAAAEIAKMENDVKSNTLLKGDQQEREMAQRRLEINAKAAFEIAKVEADARKSAIDQISSIQEQTRSLEEKFALSQRIQDLGPIQAEREQRISDAYAEQRRQLSDIAKIKNLPEADRIKAEQAVNAELQKRIDLINKEAELKLAREQDFGAGVKKAMKDFEASMTPIKQGEEMAKSVFNNMGSALDNFVETGKFNFSDFARSVIQDLLKIQLRAAATNLLSQAMASFGFANGGAFLNGRTTAFANGGIVGAPTLFPMANGMGLMGEAGPEAIMPLRRGKDGKLGVAANSDVAPRQQITNNYYSISAVDAKSVAQLFAENRMTMLGTIRQAEKELPMRGR